MRRRRINHVAIASIVLTVGFAAADGQVLPRPPAPDLVLFNGKIITVDKEDADDYLPVDSDECAVTPTTPVTPSELPTTGAADTALKLIGVTSLTGATVYYMASRRNS